MPSTAVFTMDYLNLLTYKFEISFIEGNFDMLRALVQTRVLVVHIDIQTIFLIFPPSYALMHVLILISSYFGNFLEFLLSLRSSTKSCWKCFV